MDRSVVRLGHPRRLPVAIGRPFADFDPIEYSRSSRARRHATAIFLVALFVVLAFKVFPLQNFTLIVGDTTVQVRSIFGDQQAALDAAALELAPGDRLLIGRAGDHAAVTVQRALPVLVLADGARLEVRTQARTVAGALALANVVVGDRDRVYVDGIPTPPGAQLGSIVAGGVAAAASGQSLRIEVVRALPTTPRAGGVVSSLPAPSPTAAFEAAPPARALTVLVDPFAWRQRGSALPPDMEVLSHALTVIPERRTITVVIGSETETLTTEAETVEEVLAFFEIAPGEHDRVSHTLDEAVTEGMHISVVFVEKLLEQYIEYTPAKVYRRDDHTLAPGEERIIEGEPGEVRVFQQVTYENGLEVARERHSAVLDKEPVSGEHLRGPVAGDGVSPVVVDDYDGPYTQKIRVWATWYNATHGGKAPDHPAYGITYSGLPLYHGICAVDPDFIPLHTRFYVPGYGECLAADIGGLINGYDVDLGFPEGHAPEPWHTGYVNIYILD